MNLNRNLVGWMTVVGAGLLAGPLSAADDPVLKTGKEKTSYCIGVDMARNFKRQGTQVDLDALIRGYRDSDAGAKLLLTEPELDDLRKVYMAEAMRKQAVAKLTPAEENKQKGAAFLAENKTKPGVVVLPSGLQYQVLQAGTGRKPAESDTVECNYRGVRLDGAEFFSTAAGKPASLKVSEAMVPAFREVLPLMPVGSKWKLFVPPQFAFGARGVGKTVRPSETVIFELELAAIK
jgi:FKBP-type peptidyl-prolyl cis-trans isomerase FklB